MTKQTKIRISYLPTKKLAGRDTPLLYPVEPLGLGTGHLECLSGLTLRLADRHSMMTSSFYKYVLFPHMPSDLKPNLSPQLRYYFNSNGYELNARRVSTSLGHINNTFNPYFLTLLPWSGVFDPAGHMLMKKNLSWCQQCWDQDEQICLPPYIRLSWLLRTNTVCTHHNQLLQNTCHKCNSLQPILPGIPRPWICNKCGHTLHATLSKKTAITRRNHQQEYWLSNAIEKLIERTCAQGMTLQADSLTNGLQEIVNVYSNGSFKTFSSQTNITERYLREWTTNARKPTFQLFLELCYRMDIPPDKLLLDKIQLTDPACWRNDKNPKYINMSKLSNERKNEIKKYIDKILSNNPTLPISPSAIAKRFSTTYGVLQYHFPKQYKILRERFIKWQDTLNELSAKNKHKRLEQAVSLLVKKGIYPSERQLRDLKLMLPSDLRMPSIKKRLRDLQKAFLE